MKLHALFAGAIHSLLLQAKVDSEIPPEHFEIKPGKNRLSGKNSPRPKHTSWWPAKPGPREARRAQRRSFTIADRRQAALESMNSKGLPYVWLRRESGPGPNFKLAAFGQKIEGYTNE